MHHDRGEPLSPVLDTCVDTILTQVRLLRQIASEFSSFGSSPIARPTATQVGDLLREVVDPYVVGVGDRVAIALDVAPDLPPVMVGIDVERDRHAIADADHIGIDDLVQQVRDRRRRRSRDR